MAHDTRRRLGIGEITQRVIASKPAKTSDEPGRFVMSAILRTYNIGATHQHAAARIASLTGLRIAQKKKPRGGRVGAESLPHTGIVWSTGASQHTKVM